MSFHDDGGPWYEADGALFCEGRRRWGELEGLSVRIGCMCLVCGAPVDD